MKILKSAALAAAGLLMLAACQRSPMDTTADKAALAALLADFEAGYAAGDADKLVALYWDDAVVMPPGEPAAAGHDAIRASMAAGTAAVKAGGLALEIADPAIVEVAGDVAFDSGSYVVKDATGATVDSGGYVGVYQRRDGKWRYIRDIWNSDRPVPAPAADAATEAAPSP